MAEASAHKLAIVYENTIGVTPEKAKFRNLPDTRTTIALQKDTLATERLTGTRFPAEPRIGANSVSGDIPADLSFETYNELLESALQGRFVPQGDAPAVTVSPDPGFIYGERRAGEDTVTLLVNVSSVLTSMNFALVNIGTEWATANGTISILDVDSNDNEVTFIYDDGSGVTNTVATTGDIITIDGEEISVGAFVDAQKISQLLAGDQRKSFSIIREFSDFAEGKKPFLLFRGCEVNTLSITIDANGLAKSSFTIFGQDGDAPAATAPAGSTFLDSIDNEPFDTFNGFMELDGQPRCIVTNVQININNGLQARYAVGCQGSSGTMVGQSVLDGSLTAYFDDEELYEKFVNEENLSLKVALQDSKGNQFIIDLPNLRVNSGTQPDVTADGSITIPLNFSGHLDSALGSHISITSIEAP